MKRKKNLTKTTPRRLCCPHCGAPAIIRPASEIYNDFGRTDWVDETEMLSALLDDDW